MHLVTNDSLMMVEYGNINRKQKIVNKHVKFHFFVFLGSLCLNLIYKKSSTVKQHKHQYSESRENDLSNGV